MLKKVSLSCWIFAVTVTLFMMSCIKNINVGNMQYLPMVMYIIYCLSNCKIKVDNEFKKFMMLYIPLFILFPTIQTLVSGRVLIMANMVLYTIMTLYAYFVTLDIWKNNNVEYYYIIFYLISNIIFLIQFLSNPSDLFNFESYKLIFNPDLRTNIGYNFTSTNTLGALCFGSLVISDFIKPQNNKFKIIIWISRIFILLMLLSTGSRTSLICLIVYLISKFILKALYSFIKYKKPLYMKIILMIILSIYTVFIFKTYPFDVIDRFTSYRLSGWIDSINYIMNNFGMFGIGLLNPNTLFHTILRGELNNRLTADNWYIYMFISCSYIGILAAFLIINNFINQCFNALNGLNIKEFSMIFSFLISKIVYSLFEISFFTPSDINSIMMIIMIFSFNKNYNIYKYLNYKITYQRR